MRESKPNPNPAGCAGKPIIQPPIFFEAAVRKVMNTPAPPTEESQKETSKKTKN